MSEPAISIQGLGKRYQITSGENGGVNARYSYQRLSNVLLRWFQRGAQPATTDLWALRDVSLEIGQGEIVGIIGHNGSGKSTLLKLLSRITTPTEGRVTLRGRVASLLEVGTGFHPELTGRENVFLNGTLLGLRRSEIAARFDEIVAFAGVEKFLDTPVKRYSSGMYLRLAFAVAAHLSPDILIVDEILAVGDAEFQRKCLGKLRDASTRQGRTVLLVSHNLGQIAQLCDRALLLDHGRMVTQGAPDKVIQTYVRDLVKPRPLPRLHGEFAPATSPSISACYMHVDGEASQTLMLTDAPTLRMEIEIPAGTWPEGVEVLASLLDAGGTRLFTLGQAIEPRASETARRLRYDFTLPAALLCHGDYSWLLGIHVPDHVQYDMIQNAVPFSIVDNGSPFARYNGRVHYGYFFPEHRVTVQSLALDA